MNFKSTNIARDPRELDWLLFFGLSPAIAALILAYVSAALFAIFVMFWLTVTVIYILAVPLVAGVLAVFGVGLHSLVKLWWSLTKAPRPQPKFRYQLIAACSAFALSAVAFFQSQFLATYNDGDLFEGKPFFYMSYGMVILLAYPILALFIGLRANLRMPPTTNSQHASFRGITVGIAVAVLWLISYFWVVRLQAQVAPIAIRMRMSSAPKSADSYLQFGSRGPVADAICGGDLDAARKALKNEDATITDISVSVVMQCLYATRWKIGGRSRETVLMEDRIPLILDLILRREKALGIESAKGCTPWQTDLEKELIGREQPAILQIFTDRHLPINCNDATGNPVIWNGGLHSIAILSQLQSMGLDIHRRDANGRQLLSANPNQFIGTVDGAMLLYLVDQGLELEDPKHVNPPFSTLLMQRVRDQGHNALAIAPEVVQKLFDRVGVPTAERLVEGIPAYEEKNAYRDFDALAVSFPALIRYQDENPQYRFAPVASEANAQVSVWVGTGGKVIERQARPGQKGTAIAWYQWQVPIAVMQKLQAMWVDHAFGGIHYRDVRASSLEHFNVAACDRLKNGHVDNGELNDLQMKMLAIVLGVESNVRRINMSDDKPIEINWCKFDTTS